VTDSEHDDLSSLSMLELFRVEAETQTGVLMKGLLELEQAGGHSGHLETLMRAAHSLKGAARIVNVPPVAAVSHVMEDCFVAAQKGTIKLDRNAVDVLLAGVDLLVELSQGSESEMAAKAEAGSAKLQATVKAMESLLRVRDEPPDGSSAEPDRTEKGVISPSTEGPAKTEARSENAAAGLDVYKAKGNTPERVVRLNAVILNRLLGLAGESLVESRWLAGHSESMQRLRRMHADLESMVADVRERIGQETVSEQVTGRMSELLVRLRELREFLKTRLEEVDLFESRSTNLANRLYLEVLRSRMRPFSDGVSRFPRMVRDLARALGKQVRLEIVGESTQVDRDVLERLESPLAHLLRNSVDHGCEDEATRVKAGKPAESTVRLEARHSAGMLLVMVSDDGAGVDLERVRRRVVECQLSTAEVVDKMGEGELLEFLFLPGFSVKDSITEISGRGVGLDVVQSMVKNLRGSMRVSSTPGKGTRFQLQLPLTLSVLRTLLVEVSGEPFAFPLTQIAHTLRLPQPEIRTLEGRQHFTLGDHQVGLVAAQQVLEAPALMPPGETLPVVVLGDRSSRYGVVVDKFLGERELVVQPLDPRLGKVRNINAAALMEDGAPVLIVDVDDMMQSIEKLASAGSITGIRSQALVPSEKRPKRILAVDDSLTVRELERKLLTAKGYATDVAVDGMDGWNVVRSGQYDLVITDVDMPRLDGIELTQLIKKDPQLYALPVMIVSYKDREEDRLRGLKAGADYYLTKGSFHDETLVRAVEDLIGVASE